MEYRPRTIPDSERARRESEIKELNSQRANYVFLLNEMNPVPGDPVDTSFREAIAEVDARLAELQFLPPRISPMVQSKPLPPSMRDMFKRGNMI